MNNRKLAQATLVVGTLFFLTLTTPAWANAAQDPQEGAEAAQEADSAGLVSEGDETEAAIADAQDSQAEPTGLNIPMDGTSLEAWNQSMEKVKEVGGQREYNRLQDAFDYLLMFDIGAKNNPATLASRLNGLTGNEILKRVAYRKGKGTGQ